MNVRKCSIYQSDRSLREPHTLFELRLQGRLFVGLVRWNALLGGKVFLQFGDLRTQRRELAQILFRQGDTGLNLS